MEAIALLSITNVVDPHQHSHSNVISRVGNRRRRRPGSNVKITPESFIKSPFILKSCVRFQGKVLAISSSPDCVGGLHIAQSPAQIPRQPAALASVPADSVR